MARVCVKWFPESNGFFMDDALKENLDICLKNLPRDWDFTILITGEGEVRVGKSVLGMQIACYIAYEMQETYGFKTCFNLDNNFVWHGEKLIDRGHYLGQNFKYSPLLYDEAGADLMTTKVLTGATKFVIDYFRECGQYNLVNILILPDFFDLPKGIALSRSIFLLDVYYRATEEGIFQRGFFKFFSKMSKKFLYINGKKTLDYMCQKPEFYGQFFNFYPIDQVKYRELKQQALLSRKEEKVKASEKKDKLYRDCCFVYMHQELKMKYSEISDMIEAKTGYRLPPSTIRDGIMRFEIGKIQ